MSRRHDAVQVTGLRRAIRNLSAEAYNLAHAGSEDSGDAEILVTIGGVIVTEASEIERSSFTAMVAPIRSMCTAISMARHC